ncbi:hypothetical protein [Pseudomonas rhodesiae]|uniref:hypothetical protein n=1 Tax=Pseudomonas rhodesiae TaxID=76760 RepID=UPI00241ED94A|nr:hypothetical protein [Pseudomonas rhodesiae]
MDAAIAGLLGGFIGAIASVGGMWLQNHYQAKRERAKAVLEFATQNRQQDISLAVSRGTRNKIPPAAAYVYLHSAILELVANQGASADNIEKLVEESKDTMKRLTYLNSDWVVGDAIKEFGMNPP